MFICSVDVLRKWSLTEVMFPKLNINNLNYALHKVQLSKFASSSWKAHIFSSFAYFEPRFRSKCKPLINTLGSTVIGINLHTFLKCRLNLQVGSGNWEVSQRELWPNLGFLHLAYSFICYFLLFSRRTWAQFNLSMRNLCHFILSTCKI